MAAEGATGVDGFTQFLPLIIIFVVFYFLLIRPQQKRTKEHKAMLVQLSKNDEIVTAGGIVGKVTEVEENFVKVEIANNMIVQIQKAQVTQLMPKGTYKASK